MRGHGPVIFPGGIPANPFWEDMEMFDVLIVGGGPAACSAALTLRRRNKTVLMAYADDGALGKAAWVDNYPGMPHISGKEMLSVMRAQVRQAGAEIRNSLVQRVLPMGDSFSVMIGNDLAQARGVILATGLPHTALLRGEEALAGMGVSYCATCDGMFYKGGSVAVIGAWEEAVEEANFLSTLAKVTYYAEKKHSTGGLKEEIILSPLKPLALTREQQIMVETEAGADGYDGVFVLRPAMALSQLMPELEMENGKILTHDQYRTSLDRVMIAGDLQGSPYQIAKAVGDGNIAALMLAKQLDE